MSRQSPADELAEIRAEMDRLTAPLSRRAPTKAEDRLSAEAAE